MFSFIKKTMDNPSRSAQDNATDEAINQVLSTHHVDGEPLSAMVTNVERLNQALTLDLRLPETVNPEKIHRELSQKMHLLGIKEVNLNVRLLAKANPSATELTAGKGSQSKLPKTIDAAASHKPANQAASQATNQTVNPTTGITQSSTSNVAPISKRSPSQFGLQPHPRIKHIIVVASGKGGVGKSTTTVNIALALQKLGNKVGVLDADIYGPSMPTMLGVAGKKPALENEQFVPIEAHGLAMLSIGSLLDSDNTPVAWRGPKATGALMQLFNQTNWPMLDYLVIDMPPGTGDIQLTLAQRIPVTGAIIVTTPQHIALMDAQKGIEMFNKTQIPVIGVVENMALHTCSNCGHTEAIFGEGGGDTIAKEYQVPLLGQLPLASGIRQQADVGMPSVIANNSEGDKYAHFYINIANNVEKNIAKFAKERNDGRIF